jgi:hypothetical protein
MHRTTIVLLPNRVHDTLRPYNVPAAHNPFVFSNSETTLLAKLTQADHTDDRGVKFIAV